MTAMPFGVAGPGPLLITDHDLSALTPRDAVDWMLEALRERASGGLTSPPRVSAGLGEGRVVLTAGQTPAWYGYRVYDTLPTSRDQQIVAVHDRHTGDVVAVHVGNALGAARTGALGGAALSLLGPQHPASVAVIGAGKQARTQLWAASAVLDIAEVRIASRTSASRDSLADSTRAELGLPARPVDDPRAAVIGADVVILAISAATPVLETAWLTDDVFL